MKRIKIRPMQETDYDSVLEIWKGSEGIFMRVVNNMHF
jgi:hypothetical protein